MYVLIFVGFDRLSLKLAMMLILVYSLRREKCFSSRIWVRENVGDPGGMLGFLCISETFLMDFF